MIRIALVGDHDPAITAHRAIPLALELSARACGVQLAPRWQSTADLTGDAAPAFADADGVWCVPGSPYARMEGALAAIRFAREGGVPFFGTCGGFQHALIEYTRHVLGLTDADHGESSPSAALPLIAPLACALTEATASITLRPGSRVQALMGQSEITEAFNCRYGFNESHRSKLEKGPLRISGVGAEGEARVVELDGHPFFLATLFQPERSALTGATHPLITAFVRAAVARHFLASAPSAAVAGSALGAPGASSTPPSLRSSAE